jgi:hypothetical protein
MPSTSFTTVPSLTYLSMAVTAANLALGSSSWLSAHILTIYPYLVSCNTDGEAELRTS